MIRDDLAVVILTKDEELHIKRAIECARKISEVVCVVDSFSLDDTEDIVRSVSPPVIFLRRKFTNHADQFNWAISQLPPNISWIFRLDADEYLSAGDCIKICDAIETVPDSVSGMNVMRKIKFLGDDVARGGVFPVPNLRIFKRGFGEVENRLMDEHIVVRGRCISLPVTIVDENLKPLSWWVEKHNHYASREAFELLRETSKQRKNEKNLGRKHGSSIVKLKNILKWKVYYRLPLGGRAFAYFCYRYFLRFGIFDTKGGASFHILQGFWYRYLVDLKIHEVRKYQAERNCDLEVAIFDVLGIDSKSVAPNEN